MGINLKNLDKYNEAIEFYSKALKIKTEINDVKGMANCYTNIGIIQYDLGNIDQAILYYKNSAEIYESMNEVHGMATVFGNLADIYSTKAQDETSNATQTFMDSALYYGKKAIDYAQSIKSISLEFEVSEILYNIYKLIEDKDNAIFYADEVIRLKDTLYSAEKSKALTEMTTKYETEKHQLIIRQQQDSIARHVAENKVIILERNREKADRIIAEENQQEAEHKAAIEEKEKEAYKAENERDKIIIYSFIVGFVLLGLMAVLIYRSYRIKQRINKILRSQNDEIRQKNEEITSQRDEIAAQRDQLDDALTELKETQDQLIESEKMASLGSLVTGVAHEINTPVSIGITASSSMSENTKKLAELIKSGKMTMQELQKYIQDIYKSSNLILKNLKRTGDLVQNFKQISIDQQSESQRIFELKSYLESVTHGFKNDLDTETITLSITGENIELDSYPIAFAQIITGLISNSIKYGFTNQEDKEIKINISQEKQNLIITFSDNGHGIKQEIINKIFDPFFTTNKALGTGLGLHIIYNLVKQKLSGTIDCTSIENQHTTFTLIFPNILNKL
jgi:signal transduction histidine kinase